MHAVIVDAIRTPGKGKKGGQLSGMHHLGASCGLQTMCEGGGMANATIIERI